MGDTNIDLNEFYSDRNGKEELVSPSAMRAVSFIRFRPANCPSPKLHALLSRPIWLLLCYPRLEADEERDLPERMTIKGYSFNFRNALLPVEVYCSASQGNGLF